MPENEGMAIRGESAKGVPQHVDSHDDAQPDALPEQVPLPSNAHGIADTQLANELADSARLQAISTQLIREGNLEALYQQILDAAIAVMRSDMGSMQLLYPKKNELRLLASSGFAPESAAFWEWVHIDSGSSCGEALRTRERVIVADVETCEYIIGTEDLEFYRKSGIRAVQTTPLIARNGHLLGMISTHWRTPHQPTRRNLQLLDVLARFATDLIERMQVEETLRESELRLRLALNASLSGTFIWYPAEDRGEPDAQMLRLFGLPADGTLNLAEALATMIHMDDREGYAAAVARAVDPNGDGELHEDIRVVLPDGSERWLAIAAQVFFEGAPRQPTRMAGSATDITERKRVEEALRASEERQSFLLALNDRLRSLADPHRVKQVACEMLGAHFGVSRVGYGEADLSGEGALIVENGWTDGTLPEMPRRFPFSAFGGMASAHLTESKDITIDDTMAETHFTEPDMQAALLQFGIQAGDSAMIVKDRQLAGLMFVHSTTPRHWTPEEHALLREVAERTWAAVEQARAEEALRASQLALREANQRKDDFLGIASHELRTPLTSIIANLQMARKNLATLSEMARARDEHPEHFEWANDGLVRRLEQSELLMERTDRQLARLNRLVGDLIDTSRIRVGKLDLFTETCDLLPIVREAVQEQRISWPHRTITLTLPRRASVPILADDERIGQVVTNLLTNALKYSSDEAEVAISVRLVAGSVRVAVRDLGPGISPEEQAHLFEQFYRVPGIEQQSGSGVGLGLGLHICKTIVERHRGAVGVESAVGNGSTFWFSLPLAPADEADLIPTSGEAQ